MANYKVVNPSAGNVIFDTAGSTREAGGWHVGSGVAVGLGADQSAMSNIAHGNTDDSDVGAVVASGLTHVSGASSANTFGTMTAGSYIIRRVTDTVGGGVSNTTLRSGGSNYGHRTSIHKVETSFRNTMVATAIRDGNWGIFSGVFSPAAGTDNASVGNVGGSTVTDGTADHEANVTRADQGSFTYKSAALNPTSGDYSGKNS